MHVRDVFPYLKEILTSSIGAAGYEAVKDLIKSFTKKTGEKVGEDAAGWIGYRIFGMTSEDERRFNDAMASLEENDYTRLLKKLDALDSDRNNFYRISVMQEKPADIAKVLLQHARMNDENWRRYCRIMNLRREQVEGIWNRFRNFMRTDFQDAVRTIYAAARRLGIDFYAASGRISRDAWRAIQPILNELDRQAAPYVQHAADRVNAVGNTARARRRARRKRGPLGRLLGLNIPF
jgi:hypothetical protein